MAVLMDLSSSEDETSAETKPRVAGKKRSLQESSASKQRESSSKKRSSKGSFAAMEQHGHEPESESEAEQPAAKSKRGFDDFVSSDSEDDAPPARFSGKSEINDGENDENDEYDENDGENDEDEDEDRDGRLEEAMETFELPTEEDEMEEPAVVGRRIKELLGVLNNFRQQKRAGLSRPRSDFIAQLTADCAKYYGYLPQLIELFLTLFSPNELCEFLEANEVARPVVIRTNTLKARRRELAQALASRGMNLEPLAEWSKVGLKIFESTVPVGATPEYLAGHYMLQSASSFAPVLALGESRHFMVVDYGQMWLYGVL